MKGIQSEFIKIIQAEIFKMDYIQNIEHDENGDPMPWVRTRVLPMGMDKDSEDIKAKLMGNN